MVEFLITSVDFRQCLLYGVIFFTVQFSMIWRLAKDHDFTQILTLWTFQRPKIENERSKMSIKHCDILSKSTKTIGRD